MARAPVLCAQVAAGAFLHNAHPLQPRTGWPSCSFTATIDGHQQRSVGWVARLTSAFVPLFRMLRGNKDSSGQLRNVSLTTIHTLPTPAYYRAATRAATMRRTLVPVASKSEHAALAREAPPRQAEGQG